MLLKGSCRNNIKPEYNLEQCYLALTDQLDWADPKGDRCPYDLSKPLPLQGNKERVYVISLTKIKASRTLHWESITRDPNGMKVLSVIRILVDKQFGYGYLKEIVVRRAYQNEYAFKKANFSRLHLNDMEDMFLLYVQHKLHNLTCDEIVDLVNALRIFNRSIVIKKRVKDVQLGVESYQTNLIITHPKISCADFPNKEPYTPVYEPRGVIYKNKINKDTDES
ncbi:hypothetical protein Tco_1191185 [Tanacetum coccineum]